MKTLQSPPHEGCAFIYALSDPLNRREVRYIGKTETSLPRRLAAHLGDLHKRWVCHKTNWFAKLRSEGRKPLIWPLDVCALSDWIEREKFWIATFRPLGRLTNTTEGGDAPSTSPEVGAKISAAKKGKPMSPAAYAAWMRSGHRERTIARNKRGLLPESRAKQIATMTGRKMSDAARAAWEKSGFRERTIARNKRGWSAETRAKQIACRTGKPLTLEHVAKLRAAPHIAKLIARNKLGKRKGNICQSDS